MIRGRNFAKGSPISSLLFGGPSCAWMHGFGFVSSSGVMRLPWLLAMLCETRYDTEFGIDQLVKMLENEETTDEWFGLPFWALLGRAITKLSSLSVIQCIWQWAWEVLSTACQNEFTHSRNKRRADSNSSWANFVAASYNQELNRRTQRQIKV